MSEKEQTKVPTKEGLQEARKKLKKMLKKEPSEKLVEIIKEVTEFDEKSDHTKYDIAAKPSSPEIGQ